VNPLISDIDLIDRMLAGDQTAFRLLVRRHKDFAFTVAYRILNHREEAEEVAQDAFMKAFGALADFSRTSKFTSWFYKIVFNTALEAKRKRKMIVDEITDSNALAFAVNDTTIALERRERQKQINQALTQLSPDDVTMITLFYLKEQSLEEIAHITGISNETIKVKLHRARKRLAEQLKIQLGEEIKNLY
jgi:RNA polymerase sigma factor (sigma-70 family)